MTDSPYDLPSDPAKRHRLPSRMGPTAPLPAACSRPSASPMTTCNKPLIGVATTWIETMPCNFNLRDLAAAGQGGHPGGRRHADGVQHHRGLRRRVDGRRGHAGLAGQPRGDRRLDRAGRAAATCWTAWSCIVGCDKTIPAAAMALCRLDVPGLVFYGGSIAPGPSAAATSPSRTCSRPSAPTRPARSTTPSCTRWRARPVPAPAPAAASSRPTPCPWRSSSSASAPPGSTASRRSTAARVTRPRSAAGS